MTMNIGTLNVTVGGKTKRSNNGQHTVAIDWDNLPAESRAFVITYGLKQYLADGAAGATSPADLIAGVDARVTKLATADFTRTRGDGPAKPDTEERIALRLAKEVIRAALKVKEATVEKEKLDEMAKAFLAGENPKAKEILAEAARQMKAKAKVGETPADDILADLGL